MPPIEVVILDVDGTVAHCPIDFTAMRAAVRTIAARWGIDIEKLGERGVIEQIAAAAALLSEDGRRFREEAEQAMMEIEVEAAQRAELLPGAAEALAQLRKDGVVIALITRNCRAASDIVLCGLTDYNLLLTRDDVSRPKPDPDHVYRALAATGCAASHAVMVGDYDYDMQAGRAAGVRICIGVRSGGRADGSLREAGADVILDSIADLPGWLRHHLEQPD